MRTMKITQYFEREGIHKQDISLNDGTYKPKDFFAAIQSEIDSFKEGYTDLQVEFRDDFVYYQGLSIQIVGKPKKKLLNHLKKIVASE